MRVLFTVALALGVADRSAAEVPTFNKDVAPILFAHCAACHRPGDVGPFALLTYADAKKRAGQIARLTARRIMPPWLPHPDWGTFRHARSLTPAQVAVLQAWADAGTPEGDAKDLPPTPTFTDGWQLGTPDVVLKLEKPFAIPAEGGDLYHHFVFPLNLEKDRYLKGVEVLPGNRRVAFHAVGLLDTSGTARQLAAKHDRAGYPGPAPGFRPVGVTPGFVPGRPAELLDPDAVVLLRKGTDLVLRMHYRPTGKAEADQTRVGLYFTERPPGRNAGFLLLASADLDIPPGEKAYRRSDSFTLPVDYEIHAVRPTLHRLGKEVKVWAELPDGKTRRLLWVPDWDFDWQETYTSAESIVLPKGTVLRAEFVWDNSADNPHNPSQPPQRVRHGEGASDEFGEVLLGGRPVRRSDELAAWLAVLDHYLEIERQKERK